MTIPSELDDGFTVEVAEGLYCRPMSNKTRLSLQVETDGVVVSTAYAPPYTFGNPERHVEDVAFVVLGYAASDENRDFQDLSDTLGLHVLGQAGLNLSLLKCEDCTRYAVNHDTGEVQVAFGVPKRRPGGSQLPCETHVGCVKGHYSRPRGLSNPKWAKTWSHFWRYGDRSPLADCPIHQRNLLLLRWTVDYGRNPALNPFIG